MKRLELLRKELFSKPSGSNIRNTLYARGFRRYMLSDCTFDDNSSARAAAFEALFADVPKIIYENDIIAGSVRGLISEAIPTDPTANRITESFGFRGFRTNSDHFAPNYSRFLSRGIGGTLEDIRASMQLHQTEKKLSFLSAAERCMNAFSAFIKAYADEAEKIGKSDIAQVCRSVSLSAPQNFREALQLVWLCHIAFCTEGRYAMALGRMDQYLYPFYENDIKNGTLTRNEALELVECTLCKIHEAWYFGGDDVVNIAIGGIKRDGSCAVNDLSYLLLDAVRECNIPGPNLSARLHPSAPDDFLDACLKVIGTGLGYPALMNDEINIPALARHGYNIEDARDYCMVGCIENFIQGKQPPWSDGRFNTPKYLELALNNGVCMLSGEQLGPRTGEPNELDTMEKLMCAFEEQLRYGAAEYVMLFRNDNDRLNPKSYTQPFLSCFCDDCIGRGLDINDGGAIYPSAHGACGMGIGTVADSLASIEELVYKKKLFTLAELRDILKADFDGFEKERKLMLNVPKYGNDCDTADKYAVWFVAFQNELFSHYRTRDGGAFYIAIASNIQNIPAGREIAATPDGRKAREPLSDAASPMHGMDVNGPTAAINSLSKPDYRLVSCGTVVNQKYGPDMFAEPEKRAKLAALIRTYFQKGGQELQINSVSRDILIEAMNNPDSYRNLVVRVSGFSAYYTLLSREVQEDILKRTEHC